jgi:NADPH:quinone reductase-like Zn-dependent oxidoreductase
LNALALSCGQTVAIVGGSGAVGGYAIQLAKAEDGLTVLTHAIASDEELVRSLGADLIVDTTSDIADEIRRELPDGVLGVIDGAALNEAILPAIADGGGLATLKRWNGPAERNISIHRIASFDAATDTGLFDHLRQLAEDGTLTLRVAEIMPATQAGEAHRRLAAGGLRGRLVLDFSEPL